MHQPILPLARKVDCPDRKSGRRQRRKLVELYTQHFAKLSAPCALMKLSADFWRLEVTSTKDALVEFNLTAQALEIYHVSSVPDLHAASSSPRSSTKRTKRPKSIEPISIYTHPKPSRATLLEWKDLLEASLSTKLKLAPERVRESKAWFTISCEHLYRLGFDATTCAEELIVAFRTVFSEEPKGFFFKGEDLVCFGPVTQIPAF